MDDSKIIDLFNERSERAISAVSRKYGSLSLKIAENILKSREDAEDMMIEAFARIMAKAPHISEGSFKSYLFKTGRNLTIRFHERMLHLKSFSMDGLDEEAIASDVFGD